VAAGGTGAAGAARGGPGRPWLCQAVAGWQWGKVWHGSGTGGSGCETAIKRVSRRHYLYQNPPKQPFLYLIHHFISKPPFLYQNSSFSYQKPPFLYQNSSFLYQIRPQKPEKRIKKPQKPPTAPFPPRLRTRIASVSCDVAPPPRFDFEIFVKKN
jgi:hypothetical protein